MGPYTQSGRIPSSGRLLRRPESTLITGNNTGAWSGSDAQLQAKVPGLMHLIASTPEYQLT